jgi:pimeloyl-ACP methyl ester carboxylesterase
MTAQIQRSSRVVFVPGAAGAATFWRPIIERLPAHLEPQAFDLPGLGAVPPHVGIHGYDGLVEYVRAGIDTPAMVVAQSMGAYIALTLALRHPHLQNPTRRIPGHAFPIRSTAPIAWPGSWLERRANAELRGGARTSRCALRPSTGCPASLWNHPGAGTDCGVRD